ncbi:MAG: class C sortase, partial [Clostridia bacterium]|nr:class C sortase [Clostridia bacterium]
MAYPTISDFIVKLQNTQSLDQNTQRILQSDDASLQEAFRLAEAYNEQLKAGNSAAPITDAFSAAGESSGSAGDYMSLLNVNGDGIMGSIRIPKISLRLPIYHTTNSEVLKSGAGHVEGTSLPVGGDSTHSALAGHRGLPSARLFTDLGRLEVGDYFYIEVLGQELAYCVDQIVVVLPEEVSYLNPVEGEDHVTLVTCTPYGINTHRLLVRGIRDLNGRLIEADAENAVLAYSIFIFVVSLIILLFLHRIKTKNVRL